jgi:hypothetical protein
MSKNEIYKLSAEDNELDFFRDRQDVKRCPACSDLLDKWKEDLSRVLIRRAPKYDVSSSISGVYVVTKRFRACVEDNALTGLEFAPLQAGLFSIRPKVSVPFDAARRGTRFLKQCQECGHYESVVGARPVFLASNTVIPGRGFVRTDLEFGSFDEKHPLVLCGSEAAEVLRGANLKGLTLVSNSKDVAKMEKYQLSLKKEGPKH